MGRPLRWRTIAPAELADLMRPHVGDVVADGLAGIYAAAAEAPLPPASDPALLHVGSIDLESWARAQAWDDQSPKARPTSLSSARWT